MANKSTYSAASRTGITVMTIIFLWCFGVALLIVILNMLLGFADNDAEFRTAFLSMTEEREFETLQHYLELSQRYKPRPKTRLLLWRKHCRRIRNGIIR